MYIIDRKKKDRKGSNKVSSDLQDIIRIIRLNALPDKVKFCVTTCNRLLPVGLQHIDAGTLVQKVPVLRFQLVKLSTLVNEVTVLKEDINYLKSLNERHENQNIYF